MRKTYVAPTMAQALAQVKSDLGRDAVILFARNVRKNGLLGLLGRKCLWEVIAVPHAESPSRAAATTKGVYIGSGESTSHSGKGAVAVASRSASQARRRSASLGDEDIHTILTGGSAARQTVVAGGSKPPIAVVGSTTTTTLTRDELDVLALKPGLDVPVELAATPASKSPSSPPKPSRADAPSNVMTKGGTRLTISAPAVTSPPAPPTATKPAAAPASATASAPATPVVLVPTLKPWPRELADFHAHLLRQDVEERVADELMHELSLSLTGMQADAKTVTGRLCGLIAARIPTAGPAPRKPSRTGPRVIALAGPTGVGKTTTIAKLAADFKLRQRQRVGLVTMDTYRIAAVDQLRVYAEIIEVPLRTVLSAGDMHKAVYGMDVDVVLIDSAGRSQNDQPRLNELRAFLTAADADEVHLVVSATASRRTLLTTLNRFATMAPNRTILSKLDEAETLGTILSFPSIGAAPLAYTTMGQDVPDDIEPADPWKLAQRVLRGVGDAIR